MKGLVTSIFLFMNAIAQAIGAGTTPALKGEQSIPKSVQRLGSTSDNEKDPYLIWVFAAPAIAGFVLTPLFYWLFRELDNDDESAMGLYDLPTDDAEDKKGQTDLERLDEKPRSELYIHDEKKGREIPIDSSEKIDEKEVKV